MPYIEGVENLPAGSGLQRVMRWLGDHLPGEGRGIEVARGLEEGALLPDLPQPVTRTNILLERQLYWNIVES